METLAPQSQPAPSALLSGELCLRLDLVADSREAFLRGLPVAIERALALLPASGGHSARHEIHGPDYAARVRLRCEP